ncbi:MAG: hypothetical protein ABIG30_02410, partial [Candidatus Aenigmatarchaeota archaeon]
NILWALVVGAIVIFGTFLKLKMKAKPLIGQIILSWFIGLILINISPIGGLIAAIFLRVFLTGLVLLLKSVNLSELNKKEENNGKDIDIKLKLPVVGMGLKIIVGAIAALIILGLLAVVFIPPVLMEAYDVKDVSIEKLGAASVASIDSVTWDDVKHNRLVSQEYALQIPKTMVTETGWRLSDDWDGVYPIKDKNGVNRQTWIMAYEPDKLINLAEPSPAYIRVNAENPADREKITESIPYSEERGGIIGILYQVLTGKIRDVKFLMWLRYPFFDYGDTVFTHTDAGEPVWFAPVRMNYPTITITTFYERQEGIVVLDDKGEIMLYTNEQIKNKDTPEWLLKQILIDEDYTEKRIQTWAQYNNWQNVIQYVFQHEQVYELAQDLFFQYDFNSGRNYALLQLEPEGYERKAITQFVEVESSTENFGDIKVYDARELGLVGPMRALDDVRGQISLYSDWYALQPIFKKIKGGYFYIVPVYSGMYEGMVLRAVAVVDAKTEQVKLFRWGEIGGEVEIPDSGTTTTISGIESGCSVVSTEIVNNKTRIIIEC